MRFQDGSTQARQPSLAEQRARQQALADQERQEALDAEAARAAEKKSSTKKKLLIGTGVTVGLVGLIATFYTVAKPENVTATCTHDDIVDNDQNCDENYVRSHGGHVSGGFFFIPIVGGGFNSYRYNYGGTGAIGQRVSGGSYTAPPNANISTKSGKSVQRGGFGISGKSGTSGGTGKSGGS
ncbi:hypothetical protein CFP75_22585 [Amycolatopsis alba DSM 44262]|uniref:Uncharacterized protein n=2 Tax=Amycolatopsis alba TaxID=76020 RepID=A0A229RNL3_AMYAL|nr:hypothetical protein [Amycolatopsis alba]OXM48069.1 hypothetical protein CFP75_22585 [Amycolatopsis alba DSM 44262]